VTGGLVESLIARIVLQRDLIQVMAEHSKSISARVTSRDKSVTVEVDGLGAMTGLWLSEFAYRNGAAALATLIVETAQAAAKVTLDRHNHMINEFTERLATLQYAPLTRGDGESFRPRPPGNAGSRPPAV
jgi:hypothetical protein